MRRKRPNQLSTTVERASRAVAVVLACGTAAPAARADDDGLHWDKDRPRFRLAEYIATAVLGPLAIVEYFAAPAQAEPHWVGGILFDDAARDALRLRSPDALRASWALADGTGVMLVALSVVLDSLVIPLARKSPDVAWQLLMMDAEAFTLNSLVTITSYDTIGRARPPYEDCTNHTGNVPSVECFGSLTASFPSGHIAEAFTSAGLSCAHHLFGHVYGNRVADDFACARDLTLATTEGFLRMMGDRHYASDVIAGSSIGFLIGFGVPSLLHYVKWLRRSPVSNLVVAPMVARGTSGFVVGATF